MRVAPKVEVPKLDLTPIFPPGWSPTAQPEGADKLLKEAKEAMKNLKRRRQQELQNSKVKDSPIAGLRRPEQCSDRLWNGVLQRLRTAGVRIADGHASVLPGADADVEAALKTAANTLSLVSALRLHDTLAMHLLGFGDVLWNAAACVFIRDGIIFFPSKIDGAVLENLVGVLAKAGEFEAACKVVRGCPASQMAQLMHMVLEVVMARNDQEALKRYMAGIAYAGMRLVLNHGQFVDLMRKCSEETKELLINAILACYDVALETTGKKESDWNAAALCRLTCALLAAGDGEAALMFIQGASLHPGMRMGDEILQILEADVAKGKTTLATVMQLEFHLRQEQQDMWAEALKKIRDNAPSTAVRF